MNSTIIKLSKYQGYGFITRLVYIFTVYFLPIQNIGLKVVLLLCSDFLDCWTTKMLLGDFYSKACKEFNYQVTDKIVDVFNYLIIIILLKDFDPILFSAIIIRILGVTFFYKSRNSHWLIYFPDLFKELLAYKYLIGPLTPLSIGIIYLLKTLFEYFWHTYINHTVYPRKNV